MADSKSLRLIGCGLGTLTVLVTLVAAALVSDATLIAADPPAVHTAAR
jgi:hypothetical protein